MFTLFDCCHYSRFVSIKKAAHGYLVGPIVPGCFVVWVYWSTNKQASRRARSKASHISYWLLVAMLPSVCRSFADRLSTACPSEMSDLMVAETTLTARSLSVREIVPTRVVNSCLTFVDEPRRSYACDSPRQTITKWRCSNCSALERYDFLQTG